MKRAPYRQALSALELSIERYTPDVPDDGAWYLLRAGQQIGRFRSLKAARETWNAEIAASGWTPTKRRIDPDEALARERGERWSRNRGG
jgi:hypothetical protein